MTKENIDPIIRGRIMRLRKFLTIVFLTILTLSMCFALAGCDDEDNEPEQKIYSDFELYHGERYLKEYTYFYTRLYEYDEVYETYRRVDTTWDKDDLKGYDYLLYYRDGKSDNEEWNAIFLKGKEYIKAIGETITISITDMTFDGTLGAIPLSFRFLRTGHAEFNFDLPDEEEKALFIANYTVEVNYCRANEKSDGGFLLDFWTKPIEIAGKKYKMNFYYLAPLEPGDSYWLDSLAGKVE